MMNYCRLFYTAFSMNHFNVMNGLVDEFHPYLLHVLSMTNQFMNLNGQVAHGWYSKFHHIFVSFRMSRCNWWSISSNGTLRFYKNSSKSWTFDNSCILRKCKFILFQLLSLSFFFFAPSFCCIRLLSLCFTCFHFLVLDSRRDQSWSSEITRHSHDHVDKSYRIIERKNINANSCCGVQTCLRHIW